MRGWLSRLHDRRVDQRDAAEQEGGYLLKCLRVGGGGLDLGSARSELLHSGARDLLERDARPRVAG
jgi:hypothetical protein